MYYDRTYPTVHCGTASGARKHRKQKQKVCADCLAAEAEYARTLRRRGEPRPVNIPSVASRDAVEAWRARNWERVEADRARAAVLCAARCGTTPAVVLRVWADQDALCNGERS